MCKDILFFNFHYFSIELTITKNMSRYLGRTMDPSIAAMTICGGGGRTYNLIEK